MCLAWGIAVFCVWRESLSTVCQVRSGHIKHVIYIARMLFYNICCYCWFGCLSSSSLTQTKHTIQFTGGGEEKKIFTTLIYVHHKAIYTNQMFGKQGTDKEKKKTFKSRRQTRYLNGAPLFATQDRFTQAHRNSCRECLPSTASCKTRAGNRKRGKVSGKGMRGRW